VLKIERLDRGHDREGFDCGRKPLNEFLQRTARQHADRELSRTFVLIEAADPEKILGYYTLTVCEVLPAEISDLRLNRYPHPMPAAKLARLAISRDRQRNGFGQNLLLNAMERAAYIAENAGLIGMFVEAKDDRAVAYYMRFGFVPTENSRSMLFLPIATIREALGVPAPAK
jgi:ribosomal protein S18 acetylase RimI-like enzyme